MEYTSLEYSLLSIQCALLEVISPEIRAVAIDLDENERIFYIYYYYDGEVCEEFIDLLQCATTEGTAHSHFFEGEKIQRLDYPKEIPIKGRLVYLRKEPISLCYKKEKIRYEEFSHAYAMLAMQSALLGVVTPELRAVIVDVEVEDKLLYIRFYYDGEVSEEIKKIWENAINEANKVLEDFEHHLDGKIERIDFPETMPFRGRYAYHRKE